MFYSADDALGSRVHSESVKGYSPADPNLGEKRDMTPLGISHGVSEVNSKRASSKSSYDGLPTADSNILFVGGLPNNCTRREVGRILCGLYVFLCTFCILAFVPGMAIMNRNKVF